MSDATMVHLRPVREAYATTTVCGIDLHVAGRTGRTMPYSRATDDPMPGPGAGESRRDDLRCPECWRVWRACKADGFDPAKELA